MSAKSGSLSIACIQLGPRKLSVIWSSGVSAIQGLLNVIWSSGVSAIQGLLNVIWSSGVSAIQGLLKY